MQGARGERRRAQRALQPQQIAHLYVEALHLLLDVLLVHQII
jgi:hypothetical protein